MAPMLVVALVHKAAIHAMFDHTVKRRIACKLPLVARGPLDVRDAQSEHHQRRQEKEQVGQALRRARELGRFLLDARRAPVDEGTDDAVRDEGGALHLLACRRRDGPALVEPRLDSGVVVGVAVGRHHRSVETRAAQRAHERVGHLSLWRVVALLAEERALKHARVQARAAARPHHRPLLLLAVFGAPHAQEVCDCMLLRAVCVGERRVAPTVGNGMVRAGLVHQEAHHLQLPLRSGDVDGAARVVVALVDLRARGDEAAELGEIAVGGCLVEVECVVRPLHVRLDGARGAAGLQELDHRLLASEERVSEGRVAPPVGGRVVRLGLVHKELHNLQLPLRCGDMQRAARVVVLLVRVGAGLDEPPHQRDVTGCGGVEDVDECGGSVVSALPAQVGRQVLAPGARRILQAGEAPPVERVHAGAALFDQEARDAQSEVAVLDGRADGMQRGPLVVVCRVDRHARLEESAQLLDVALDRRVCDLEPARLVCDEGAAPLVEGAADAPLASRAALPLHVRAAAAAHQLGARRLAAARAERRVALGAVHGGPVDGREEGVALHLLDAACAVEALGRVDGEELLHALPAVV
mmetsp:Transcript_37428/g.123448  ORF Transcript_37428/g.123448 Transcript_37428/m.123448 type:complete len:583 (-) Transcript_37428:804-2552(-)